MAASIAASSAGVDDITRLSFVFNVLPAVDGMCTPKENEAPL